MKRFIHLCHRGCLASSRQTCGGTFAGLSYVTTGTFAALLGVPDGATHLPDPDAPLCMSLASLLPVLRRAGYGSGLEEVTA